MRRPSRRPKPAAPNKSISNLEIQDLTSEGKGLSRVDGKVIFIDGALPGEVVDVRLTKSSRQFDEADIKQIHSTSPNRIEPTCQHFAECGGCQLQHMPISLQHQAKENGARQKFRKLISPEQTIEWVNSPEWGYRRRARLSVFVEKGAVRMGFRAKASNQIIDVLTCPVLTPPLQDCLPALHTWLSTEEVGGKVGHIELLEDASGTSVTVRLSRTMPEALRAPLVEWAENGTINLYWQEPDATRLAISSPHFYLIGDDKIGFHPQDFVQVNGDVNEKMVAQALDWLSLSSNDTVLDLFCGAGNFSLPLARRSQKVYAIEGLDSLVEAGKQNAQNNGVDNLEFIGADLTQPAGKWLQKANITKVLLDPPRAGAFEFLPTLVKLKPKQILYVSCNVATLARDAEYLVDHGYKVCRVSLMDMFPHTSHLESMMLLQRS